MREKTMRRAAGLALAAAALAAPAGAQVTLTPRALGTGGSYVALARGHEALFQNPANLGLPGTPYWSLAFPQLSASASFDGIGLGDLPELAEGNDQPQEVRDRVLAAVPEGGVSAAADLRIPLVALQNGRFAVGMAYGALVEQTMGRDLVDLVLNGYQTGRTDYAVDNTVGSRATFLDFAAAYGRKVGPVSVGVTGHYLRGRSLVRTRLFEPRYDLEAQDVEMEYREVMARGGSGWGVDVGLAAQPVRDLTLSVAVANLWGRMEWDEELVTRHLTVTRATFDVDNPQELVRQMEDTETAVDPAAVPYTVYQTAAGLYDEAFFPATLRAGVAYARPASGTALTASYQGELTEGRLGGGWERQVGLGVEQKVPLATLRAGFATDLDGSRMLTGGASLGPLQVGVGRTTRALGDGVSRTGWVGTFGLTVRTTGAMP